MKIRKRNKDKMRYAPKWLGSTVGRKDGIYYNDYCCKTCFWDWGFGFANQHLYKTDCTESNYLGYLKKNWVSSRYDYSQTDEEYLEYERSKNQS